MTGNVESALLMDGANASANKKKKISVSQILLVNILGELSAGFEVLSKVCAKLFGGSLGSSLSSKEGNLFAR